MAWQWTRVGHLQVEMVCGQLFPDFVFDTNLGVNAWFCESDFSDNSVTESELSEDEPFVTPCRRPKANIVVNDSDDDTYGGYHLFIGTGREISVDSPTTLVNLSPTKTLLATSDGKDVVSHNPGQESPITFSTNAS